MLAEVLDHIVPLVLAMHDDVKPDLLLQRDALGNLALVESDVLFLRNLALFELRPFFFTSAVCGKDPIVVVGNKGRFSFAF